MHCIVLSLCHVNKYVQEAKKLLNTVTCTNVKALCADKLAITEISFFASIGAIFEPFLKRYQWHHFYMTTLGICCDL